MQLLLLVLLFVRFISEYYKYHTYYLGIQNRVGSREFTEKNGPKTRVTGAWLGKGDTVFFWLRILTQGAAVGAIALPTAPHNHVTTVVFGYLTLGRNL